MATKIVVAGCCGRMGQRIGVLALADAAAFQLAGGLEARGHDAIGQDLGTLIAGKPIGVRVTDQLDDALRAGEVLIDFTQPEATLEHLQAAVRLKKAMVIGTTGLTDAQRAQIEQAAAAIPVVYSPNMSVGVNVLFELVELAAKRLGLAYDVEVVEAHHKMKKDSPSGTAKRLVEGVARGRQQPPASVPTHAIRAGDIVGDHTVVFAGVAERLELTHRAQSRDVFAQGALRAAQFAAGQQPGLYDMSHVLQGLLEGAPHARHPQRAAAA